MHDAISTFLVQRHFSDTWHAPEAPLARACLSTLSHSSLHSNPSLEATLLPRILAFTNFQTTSTISLFSSPPTILYRHKFPILPHHKLPNRLSSYRLAYADSYPLLNRHARTLQDGLSAIADKIEEVKLDNAKLERDNLALQDYIGGLTQSMSRTNLPSSSSSAGPSGTSGKKK